MNAEQLMPALITSGCQQTIVAAREWPAITSEGASWATLALPATMFQAHLRRGALAAQGGPSRTMADRPAALTQFMDVTGASREAAGFFLDSSGGEVDAAIDQFFATGGEFKAAGDGAPDEDPEEPPPQTRAPPVATPGLCALPALRGATQERPWPCHPNHP